MSASPSGPGPPSFATPVSFTGMDINGQRSKRIKLSHDAPQDRLEISPPSPSITASSLALTSPSNSDAQILSPAAIYQSMEHGNVDALTPEGLNVLKNLNFSTATEEGDDYVYTRKQKTPRDPMSHRIIEKRRRDRMNNCLADLSRLIPPNFLKQGQGRIEKTEIIEMAIKHLNHLHSILPKEEMSSSGIDISKTQLDEDKEKSERFLMGYKECGTELMRFLMDQEGLTTKDRLFIRVVNHLAEKEKAIKHKVVTPEFFKTLDPPSLTSFNSNCSTSASTSSSSSSFAFPPDIKQLAKDPSETASTSDRNGSDETHSANGSCSRQSKNVSVRSESSGYASAYTTTNRGLREELGLSEQELEERIKSQQTKGKIADRMDAMSVGVTESSLRDLLSNPEPLIPLQYNSNFESVEPSCGRASALRGSGSIEDSRCSIDPTRCSNDPGRFGIDAHSRSSVNAFSTTSSVASSRTTTKEDPKKMDSTEVVESKSVCDESCSAEQSPPQIVLSSGTAETDSKIADSNSNSAFNFKKDLKQRFSNEREEHGQACPNQAHKSLIPITSGHQHTRNSLMRGHNSKDSKDKIMEGFIQMKRKQEQDEKTEEGGISSPTSPSPPETSSSCSDKAVAAAQSPMGIPCFALHPSGTFYVPIAIHPNLIQSTLEKKLGSRSPCPTLCHPVSIPVNFMSNENPTTSYSLHNINVGVAP